MDNTGAKQDMTDAGREKAEERLGRLSVAMTGARPGDVLIGTSKATLGAVIRIHGECHG